MASRENSSDSTSNSGKSYPAGSAAATGATSTVKGISITKDTNATLLSKLGKSGAFNGHSVEIFADGAVWDTTSNVYLYPGKDFNPGDVQEDLTMPINKYFGGHGSEVMSDMTKKHGAKKGKQVFYATANKRNQNPGDIQEHGSLEDITALENSAGKGTLKLSGYLATPGQECHEAEKNHEKLSSWKARDVKDLPDYKTDVVYHGPDTDYRAEEIDLTQYGRSYEPTPLKDYFKTEEKMEERTYRLREQDEYDEAATPGAVPKKPLKSSQSYGAHGFREDETELDDNRSFENQREYAAGVTKAPEVDAAVKGIDRKKGSKIR